MKVVDECYVREKRVQHQYVSTPFNDEVLCDLDDLVVQPKRSWYPSIKTFCELAIAIPTLIILTPVLIFFAILIRVTSKGPAFYSQRRLGRNGREYVMMKLRTMVHDAESGTGAVWAGTKDPRVTTLGKFLRGTQIDEFPQLLNVILGQMSLIGPRPERPEIADRLELDIPNYKQRLHVKPGITGLAQLCLPADTDIQSVRKKLIPDLYYVRNMGPWLDLRILFFTIIYFFTSITKIIWSVISLPTVPDAKEALIVESEDEEVPTVSRAS